MCGICGILNLQSLPDVSREMLEPMTRSLQHRGPDDEGFYVRREIGLGFRRLSIVDIAAGAQPMHNEDASIWIVFNGEIYNHSLLRTDLEKRGHRYRTRSDTETILHLYEEYGEDCLESLRGMFAFAIWDERRRRLFCARDRLGIKPFYYTVNNERFVFASEMKAVCEAPYIRASLNRKALPEFFSLGYLSGTSTLFDGISRLSPGHCVSLDLDDPCPHPKIRQYWDLAIEQPDDLSSEAAYIERFRDLFEESVRLRLMSDVPLGVFLSGGLDSSSIAAVMAKSAGDRIKTFSVGYTESTFSELSSARIVAKHIGSEHNEIVIDYDDFWNSLPQLIWHEDEPLAWPSSVALHFVSSLAAKQVKVVLTGEGADELFAGYLKYPATVFNMKYGSMYEKAVPPAIRAAVQAAIGSQACPSSWRRKLAHSFLNHSTAFEHLHLDNFYCAFPPKMKSELFTAQLRDEVGLEDEYAASSPYFKKEGSGSLLSRLLYFDIKTYLPELLMKQDQMSMSASIESRVPFLDHKLVEFSAGMPDQLKLKRFSGKYVLKQAMKDLLPPEIVNRRKMGFPTPFSSWLQHQLLDRTTALLTDGRLADRKIVRPEFVRDLLEIHRSGRANVTDALWRLLTFELWHRVHVDRDPHLLTKSPALMTA